MLVIWHTWSTVRVKLWIAAGMAPFVAVIVIGYVPPVFAAGVPEIVAVLSPLSVHVSPGGSGPTTDNMARGQPGHRDCKAPGQADDKDGAARHGDLAGPADRKADAGDLRRGKGGSAGELGRRGRFCRSLVPAQGQGSLFFLRSKARAGAIWRVAAAARTARVAMDAGVPACDALAARRAGVVTPAPPAPGSVIRWPRQTWSERARVSCTSIQCPEVPTDRRPGQRAVALSGPGDLFPRLITQSICHVTL